MSNPQRFFAERSNHKEVEEGVKLAPKFDENGLIPVVASDAQTGDVLMLAYMNAEALTRTLELGQAVYFSRSRKKLWHKGEESGNIQIVKELRVDCDQDAIWLKVEQVGGAACHNGYHSCFYRKTSVGEAVQNAPVEQPLTLTFTEKEKVFDPQAVYGKK